VRIAGAFFLDWPPHEQYDEHHIQSIYRSAKYRPTGEGAARGMAPRTYSMKARGAQAARTRERILDAALAGYRGRGIGATSLQAIARRADVSPATVLNHFGSAEELARVVVGRLSDSLRVPDDRAWPERGRQRRIRRLVREMFEFYDRSQPWFEVFRAELGSDPSLRDGEVAYRQAIGDLYARVFGAALRVGRVRGAVFGLTHPATLVALRESGLSLDDATELVADTLVRVVRQGSKAD
jgi:AcrR family transcriptional regulator